MILDGGGYDACELGRREGRKRETLGADKQGRPISDAVVSRRGVLLPLEKWKGALLVLTKTEPTRWTKLYGAAAYTFGGEGGAEG